MMVYVLYFSLQDVHQQMPIIVSSNLAIISVPQGIS